MVKNAEWNKDLKYGKLVEQRLLDIIQMKYPDAYIVGGYCKGYDIVIPNVATVEVKGDKQNKKTGNFFLEVESWGKQSGLATTTADYWALYDEEYYYFITPDALRELISVLELPLKVVDTNETDMKIKGYIIPRQAIELWCLSRWECRRDW